jgi:hypothetical protein
MQRIVISYLNECLGAMIVAWRTLMEATAREAVSRTKWGKGERGDTLFIDAAPEIIMKERLHDFNKDGLFITEEYGESAKKLLPADPNPDRQEPVFISDPTDRSKYLQIFLRTTSENNLDIPIGDLMSDEKFNKEWEQIGDKPATITGATSAISCIRKGSIAFSIILNYITKTVFVAAPENVVYLKLSSHSKRNLEEIDYDYILNYGKALDFPPSKCTCRDAEDFKRFVTYLGKSGYAENFADSMIFMDHPETFLHHKEPGGPARILYLSELQKGHGPIGFIVANGEKITEWIHWLAFAKFSKNKKGERPLRVFEIFIERPWTKEGILMSTSPSYSIFICEENRKFIDVCRLRNFQNPSKFRSMLVVVPADNERIITTMKKHKYRDISDFF